MSQESVIPTLQNIEEAYKTIDPIFLNSPQYELQSLNEQLEFSLVSKLETLNPIRSFKGRGTSWLLSKANKSQALVCASAGNFGQGMAYCARQKGVDMTVFAAQNANPLKLKRMQDFGATVKLAGQDFDAAKDEARAYAASANARFVEDSKDIETAEGAGTIALELLNYPKELNAVLVPLGNGALINGIGAYLKAKSPNTKVIGVVAEQAPAMDLSWREDKLISTQTANTIADGIAIRLPVAEALEAMKYTVDDIVQVSEKDIVLAMKLAQQELGIILEPAGAVSLAAVVKYKKEFKGQCLASIMCGSNVTAEQIKTWLI